MSWSTKRKFIYLCLFILAIGIPLSIAFYFITYEKPSCFDNEQNQREDGIDCGGPCVKLCKPLELLPVAQWQQTFEVTPGVYSSVAYIQNPNADAEASNVPYSFKIYDNKNNLLLERKGLTYIPAGKNFAVFESAIKIASGTPAKTDFEFSTDFTWQLTQTKPNLTVNNITIVNTNSPSVEADISNKSYVDVPRVDVVAIIYNADGQAIEASKTYIDYLDKQTTEHVVFTWPRAFESVPTRVEIIPVFK